MLSLEAVPVDEELVEKIAEGKPAFGPFFWICMAWLALLAFLVIFANLLPFQNPLTLNYFAANAQPGHFHWLGTDDLGRDILSRTVFGARTSVVIGVAATAISVAIGGTLGMLAAYWRGRFDTILSTFMYCGLAFPAIIAVIAIITFWGRSELHVIVVVGIFGIPLIYRLVRAATLACATKEYVVAARSQGATSRRVLMRDIFPNVAPSLVAYTVFTIAGVIAVEGALAFLGLSVLPPAPSWGNIIAEANGVDPGNWSLLLSPVVALFLTLVSLNYVGEKIRARYDVSESKL